MRSGGAPTRVGYVTSSGRPSHDLSRRGSQQRCRPGPCRRSTELSRAERPDGAGRSAGFGDEMRTSPPSDVTGSVQRAAAPGSFVAGTHVGDQEVTQEVTHPTQTVRNTAIAQAQVAKRAQRGVVVGLVGVSLAVSAVLGGPLLARAGWTPGGTPPCRVNSPEPDPATAAAVPRSTTAAGEEPERADHSSGHVPRL